MQCIGKHNSIWHTRTWLLRVPILCCYRNNLTVTQRWGDICYLSTAVLSWSVPCHIASDPDQFYPRPDTIQPPTRAGGNECLSHRSCNSAPVSGTRFSASWVWMTCLMAPLLPCLCHCTGKPLSNASQSKLLLPMFLSGCNSLPPWWER